MNSAQSSAATKLTPLYHRHVALKARLADWEGWQVAADYGDPDGEAAHAVSSCGVSDISAMAKVDIKGNGVDGLLKALGIVGASTPGQVAIIGSGTGIQTKSLGPGFACRLAPDQALLITETSISSNTGVPMDLSSLPRVDGAYSTNVTSVYAGISLVGPRAIEVLSRLTQVDISDQSLQSPSCVQAGVASVGAIIVRSDMRSGTGALPSYHIFVGSDVAEYVWDSIFLVGREGTLKPFGVATRKSLGWPGQPGTGAGVEGRR